MSYVGIRSTQEKTAYEKRRKEIKAISLTTGTVCRENLDREFSTQDRDCVASQPDAVS